MSFVLGLDAAGGDNAVDFLTFFERAVAEDDKEIFLLLPGESSDPGSFFFGVRGVFDVDGLGVFEDFAGFTERDAVLFEVARGFGLVRLIASHNPWLLFQESSLAIF